MMSERGVTVKIWSTVYHLLDTERENDTSHPVFIGWDEEEQPAVFSAREDKDDDRVVRENIRYETDGVFTVEEDRMTLTYEESEEMGMEGCATAVIFDRRDPATVVMNRTGNAAATMIFCQKEPRQHCLYETGVAGFPLDLCIRTRQVKNLVTERGGTLLLDYVIEMRGVCTERTVLRMQIKPI